MYVYPSMFAIIARDMVNENTGKLLNLSVPVFLSVVWREKYCLF